MKNKGLTTLEVCLLIILVAIGLLAMQGYLRRAIQANWRINTDNFSDEQFEPGLSREIFPDNRDNNPAIVFSVNPNPVIPGNYHSRSHIAAFRPAERPQDPDEALRILTSTDASEAGILRIENWGTYRSEADEED